MESESAEARPHYPNEPVNDDGVDAEFAVQQQTHVRYWALFGALICGYVALFFVGEPSRRFALNGLQSLPFLILAILAYYGERNPGGRIAAFAYWLILMIVIAGVALFMTMGAVMRPEQLQLHGDGVPRVRSLDALFYYGGPRQLVLTALGLMLIGAFSMCLYLRPMRRAAAGLLPVYADSFVHAVALATVVCVTGVLLVPLMVIGEPPLLQLLSHFEGQSILDGMSKEDQYFDTLSSFIWLVPSAVLAVGFPFVRTIRESLERVGLVRPTVLQVLFGLFAAMALLGLMLGVDFVITWLWRWMGWRTTDGKQFEELMKFAINPVGAAVIGVTAGLGEELFARGVLQPRLGIVLSNLLFTSMHALQYNWDALTSVFLIGLILGVIRQRTNTTTSAIVHGTYDFTLLIGAYYQWPGF